VSIAGALTKLTDPTPYYYHQTQIFGNKILRNALGTIVYRSRQ